MQCIVLLIFSGYTCLFKFQNSCSQPNTCSIFCHFAGTFTGIWDEYQLWWGKNVIKHRLFSLRVYYTCTTWWKYSLFFIVNIPHSSSTKISTSFSVVSFVNLGSNGPQHRTKPYKHRAKICVFYTSLQQWACWIKFLLNWKCYYILFL